jgi:glycosyltransferase involved in cell wall biosynthesis
MGGAPVRVAFLDDIDGGDLLTCGSRRVLLDLILGLDRSRFTPFVFLRNPGKVSHMLEEAGITVETTGSSPLMMTSFKVGGRLVVNPAAIAWNAALVPIEAARYAGFLRRHRIEVAYLANYPTHMYGGLACRMAGVPSVWHLQAIIQAGKKQRLLRGIHRNWGIMMAANTVAISHTVAESAGGETLPRVIWNGVDTQRFSPGRPERRRFRELGLDPGGRGRIVGLVSLLSEYKRIDLLPPLVEAVVSRAPDVSFLVCGGIDQAGAGEASREDGAALFQPSDEQKSSGVAANYLAVVADLERRKVRDNVIFTGRRDDVPSLLKGMDVFVHLCEREGFGLALAEAMATGIPVATFQSPTAAELIDDGVSGLLAGGPEDVGPLAAAVLRLLDDKDLRARIGEAGREHVAQRFSCGAFVKGFADLFEELARGNRRRAFVAPSPDAYTGGPSANTRNFLASPAFARNDVVMVDVTPPHGDYSTAKRALHSIRLFGRLGKALAVRRPEAVYLMSGSHTGFYEKSLMGLVSRAFGAGTVLHLVGGEFRTFAESGRFNRFAVPWMLRRTTLVACVGGSWADYVRSIAPTARVRDLPNPVLTAPILARTLDVNRSTATVDVRFLYVGLMSPVKGPLDLVEACDRHQARLRGLVRVTLAGGGSLLESVRQRISKAGIADFVEAVGYVPEEAKLDLLAGADAFVLPSRAEGLPVAVLEAMAAGLPIIASDVGAVPDVVDDTTGILIPPANPDAIADAMLKLARAGAHRLVLGQNGRQRVLDRYDVEAVGSTLDRLWDEAALLRRG